jgi:N-acetylmuramoyl-L-alanine amidase
LKAFPKRAAFRFRNRVAAAGFLAWECVFSLTCIHGQTPQPKNEARFVVVLDAAHGGDDSGATLPAPNGGQTGAPVAEKNITLALSVRLRSLLTARGFTVVTTREGNVNLDGNARAQAANRAVASAAGAACLSLHATESGTGVHVFVSSLPATQPQRFLAWKTAQSAYVGRSLKLAGAVNSALEHSLVAGGGEGGSAAGPIPATLGRASLPGIDSMTCPAVAVEIAPMRAPDRKVITEVTDSEYQAQVVEALAAGLLEWKTELDTESDTYGRSASSPGRGRTP